MLIKYKKNKSICSYDDENPPFVILPLEKLVGPFESCGECPFAAHGFICYSYEGECLKTNLNEKNKNRKGERNEIEN